MKSLSRVSAGRAGGRTRIDVLRSSPPILLRQAADAVYLVGGAAGPLGGDDLRLEIEVGPGAHLTLRSAAASLALPGAGEPSTVTIQARVGAGGRLEWLPEPLIAGAACNHRASAVVRLDPGAELVWREEIVLGRTGEEPGDLRSRIEVTLGARPLLRTELGAGPTNAGWNGAAALGDAGAVGSLVVCSPQFETSQPAAASLGDRGALLPLCGPAVLVSALGADALEVREVLERAGAILALD